MMKHLENSHERGRVYYKTKSVKTKSRVRVVFTKYFEVKVKINDIPIEDGESSSVTVYLCSFFLINNHLFAKNKTYKIH